MADIDIGDPRRERLRWARLTLSAALASIGVLLASFWPVVFFWRRIELDPGLFATEWLKIVFGGVIVFAIVEVLLDRNRDITARLTLQTLFASEVIMPLKGAAARIGDTLSATVSHETYDADGSMAGVGAAYERVAAALSHLLATAINVAHAAQISDLSNAFNEYDWRTAIRELRGVKEWREANIAELQRLAAHVALMSAKATDIQVSSDKGNG